MTILNITTQVNWLIDDQWREWMRETYLPSLIATGMFTHYQMVRLLEVDEEDGPTYAVQLYMPHTSSIREYREKHLHEFHQQQKKEWGENAYSFTSLMEVIN